MCWSTRRGPLAGAQFPRDTIVDCHCNGAAVYLVSSRDDVCEDDQPGEQGRHPGPLPAPGPQRVGPGGGPVGAQGAVQLRPRGHPGPLDRAAIKRLVASLSKLLDPADALAATAGPDLVFLESRPFGGAFVLDALWRRLGIDKVITALDAAPRRGRPRAVAVTERVLFGLVANRDEVGLAALVVSGSERSHTALRCAAFLTRTRRLIRQVIYIDFSQHPRYGAVCPGTVLQVLILEGKCLCWRAKPAHLGWHLPLLPHRYDGVPTFYLPYAPT